MAGGYSFMVTFVTLALVDLVIGLSRLSVSTEVEEIGLDLTPHGDIMGVGEPMGGEPRDGQPSRPLRLCPGCIQFSSI